MESQNGIGWMERFAWAARMAFGANPKALAEELSMRCAGTASEVPASEGVEAPVRLPKDAKAEAKASKAAAFDLGKRLAKLKPEDLRDAVVASPEELRRTAALWSEVHGDPAARSEFRRLLDEEIEFKAYSEGGWCGRLTSAALRCGFDDGSPEELAGWVSLLGACAETSEPEALARSAAVAIRSTLADKFGCWHALPAVAKALKRGSWSISEASVGRSALVDCLGSWSGFLSSASLAAGREVPDLASEGLLPGEEGRFVEGLSAVARLPWALDEKLSAGTLRAWAKDACFGNSRSTLLKLPEGTTIGEALRALAEANCFGMGFKDAPWIGDGWTLQDWYLNEAWTEFEKSAIDAAVSGATASGGRSAAL